MAKIRSLRGIGVILVGRVSTMDARDGLSAMTNGSTASGSLRPRNREVDVWLPSVPPTQERTSGVAWWQPEMHVPQPSSGS